jgi:hypothetical protein
MSGRIHEVPISDVDMKPSEPTTGLSENMWQARAVIYLRNIPNIFSERLLKIW